VSELTGAALRIAPVDAQGRVDPVELAALAGAGALVSVMAANNETGVLQALDRVAAALDEDCSLHVDAVAAAPFEDLAPICALAPLVSIAGTKLGGPAGIGALLVRSGELRPQLLGGGQEAGRRAGTPSVAAALGLALSLEAAAAERRAGEVARLAARRDRFEERLRAAIDGLELSVRDAARLPGHTHLLLPGLRSEELLLLLDQAGLCCSSGAACASGAPQASEVLVAMGMDESRARSAIRLTASCTTTEAELDLAVELLSSAVGRLRA
jgi:cysteine desulfurase